MKAITLTSSQARSRLVAPDDMVSCNLAFIDCKLPGSLQVGHSGKCPA
jgi:hypothetical protein